MENQQSGFQSRVEKFNEEFEKLQKKYAIKLYAANCVLKTGEVIPLIRAADDLKIDFVSAPKTHENPAKQGNPINSKTQKEPA